MNKLFFILSLTTSVFFLSSCRSVNQGLDSKEPFDTISLGDNSVREKIVIISDLHLGSNLSYSENVKHLKRLEQFLNEVKSSTSIKELVIGGDMIDEWSVPMLVNTYSNGSQTDFVKKLVATNKGVFDALNSIIKDGKIKVTYLPGNHDMGITPENVDMAMPGVNQARDSKDKSAVGTYYPDGYPQIAIEHGHRYDFFCLVTPNANEGDAPGAIFPPGYFYARIGIHSYAYPTTMEAATKMHEVTLNAPNDAEQKSKFIYSSLWQKFMKDLIYVKEDFNKPIIKTNIGNYTKTYAINDILPKNAPDGSIQMNLYNNLFTQTYWETLLKDNIVPVMTEITRAIVGAVGHEFIDDQANEQYFQNSLSSVRIVVFGHTHVPIIKSYTNLKGQECIYANSGTWEDQNTRDKKEIIDQDNIKMDFIIITPFKSDKKKLQVGLYQYHSGKHLLKGSKEVTL